MFESNISKTGSLRKSIDGADKKRKPIPKSVYLISNNNLTFNTTQKHTIEPTSGFSLIASVNPTKKRKRQTKTTLLNRKTKIKSFILKKTFWKTTNSFYTRGPIKVLNKRKMAKHPAQDMGIPLNKAILTESVEATVNKPTTKNVIRTSQIYDSFQQAYEYSFSINVGKSCCQTPLNQSKRKPANSDNYPRKKKCYLQTDDSSNECEIDKSKTSPNSSFGWSTALEFESKLEKQLVNKKEKINNETASSINKNTLPHRILDKSKISPNRVKENNKSFPNAFTKELDSVEINSSCCEDSLTEFHKSVDLEELNVISCKKIKYPIAKNKSNCTSESEYANNSNPNETVKNYVTDISGNAETDITRNAKEHNSYSKEVNKLSEFPILMEGSCHGNINEANNSTTNISPLISPRSETEITSCSSKIVSLSQHGVKLNNLTAKLNNFIDLSNIHEEIYTNNKNCLKQKDSKMSFQQGKMCETTNQDSSFLEINHQASDIKDSKLHESDVDLNEISSENSYTLIYSSDEEIELKSTVPEESKIVKSGYSLKNPDLQSDCVNNNNFKDGVLNSNSTVILSSDQVNNKDSNNSVKDQYSNRNNIFKDNQLQMERSIESNVNIEKKIPQHFIPKHTYESKKNSASILMTDNSSNDSKNSKDLLDKPGQHNGLNNIDKEIDFIKETSNKKKDGTQIFYKKHMFDNESIHHSSDLMINLLSDDSQNSQTELKKSDSIEINVHSEKNDEHFTVTIPEELNYEKYKHNSQSIIESQNFHNTLIEEDIINIESINKVNDEEFISGSSSKEDQHSDLPEKIQHSADSCSVLAKNTSKHLLLKLTPNYRSKTNSESIKHASHLKPIKVTPLMKSKDFTVLTSSPKKSNNRQYGDIKKTQTSELYQKGKVFAEQESRVFEKNQLCIGIQDGQAEIKSSETDLKDSSVHASDTEIITLSSENGTNSTSEIPDQSPLEKCAGPCLFLSDSESNTKDEDNCKDSNDDDDYYQHSEFTVKAQRSLDSNNATAKNKILKAKDKCKSKKELKVNKMTRLSKIKHTSSPTQHSAKLNKMLKEIHNSKQKYAKGNKQLLGSSQKTTKCNRRNNLSSDIQDSNSKLKKNNVDLKARSVCASDRKMLRNSDNETNSDVLHDIQCHMVASEDELKELEKLNIQISWKLPVLHQIDTGSAKMSLTHLKEKLSSNNASLSTKKFTKEEEKIIIKNWNKFSKKYKFENPELFMPSTQLFGHFSCAERLKFKQYLAKGLPDRRLFSVYLKFVDIFGVTSRGRWSEKEDRLLLNLYHSYDENGGQEKYGIPKHMMLKKALGRSWMSVYRRLQILLQDEDAKKLTPIKATWSPEMDGKLIHYLLKKSRKSLKELKYLKISLQVWNTVASKLELSTEKVKDRWKYHLYPQLYAKMPVLRHQLYSELILWFNKSDLKDWAEIDWHRLSVSAGDLGSTFLYRCFRTLVTNYVPKFLHKDFRACVQHLYETYLPTLMGKQKSKMLKRRRYNPKKRLLEDIEEDEADCASFRIKSNQ